jgi:hypothetical protein
MKNLSESQTKIIELIASEFEKINEVKSNNSNKLFDVNIIYDNIKKRNAIILEVDINNKHMRALYHERMIRDTEQLNNSLNEIGIQATKEESRIVIGRIDGKLYGSNINIYYNTDSIYISISSSESVRKIGKIKELTCYLYSQHKANSFASIEEICKEQGFINAIQRFLI